MLLLITRELDTTYPRSWSGADPGFEKGGGAVAFLVNLADFLKNLGQKGVSLDYVVLFSKYFDKGFL